MPRIAAIVGSTRNSRLGLQISQWVQETANCPFLELLDLADIDLPFFDEPRSPKSGTAYQFEHTKRWASTVSQFDGFVFVFPEYNGSYPAVLKNAIDFLYHEWQSKPASYVSYGFGAGKRAAAAFEALAKNVDLQLTGQVANLKLSPEILSADGSIAAPETAFAAEANTVEKAVSSVLTAVQSR